MFGVGDERNITGGQSIPRFKETFINHDPSGTRRRIRQVDCAFREPSTRRNDENHVEAQQAVVNEVLRHQGSVKGMDRLG